MQRKSAHFLFLAVLGMLVIGIVMLFSTSAFARDAHGDVYFFIKRQSLWLGIGLAVLIMAALVDYHFWYHTWWLWFLLALGTLALCFVPHFGPSGAPPPGQNTDTNVSLASQLISPSACTGRREAPAGPALNYLVRALAADREP